MLINCTMTVLRQRVSTCLLCHLQHHGQPWPIASMHMLRLVPCNHQRRSAKTNCVQFRMALHHSHTASRKCISA